MRRWRLLPLGTLTPMQTVHANTVSCCAGCNKIVFPLKLNKALECFTSVKITDSHMPKKGNALESQHQECDFPVVFREVWASRTLALHCPSATPCLHVCSPLPHLSSGAASNISCAAQTLNVAAKVRQISKRITCSATIFKGDLQKITFLLTYNPKETFYMSRTPAQPLQKRDAASKNLMPDVATESCSLHLLYQMKC